MLTTIFPSSWKGGSAKPMYIESLSSSRPHQRHRFFFSKKPQVYLLVLWGGLFLSLYIQIQKVFRTATESLFSSNRMGLPGIVAVTFKIFFCLWKDAVYFGDPEALGLWLTTCLWCFRATSLLYLLLCHFCSGCFSASFFSVSSLSFETVLKLTDP